MTISLAAVAAAYMFFVWLPGRKQLAAIGEEIETKREVVARAADLTKTLTASQKELESTRAVAKKWLETAPDNRDLPAMFGRINAMAKESGLAVLRFDPEPLVVHEAIREIPLTIGCSGKFSQVFEFLMKVESLPESVWTNEMRLEKSQGNRGNVRFSADLAIFSGNPYSSDCITQER